jgi:hypothetical protein
MSHSFLLEKLGFKQETLRFKQETLRYKQETRRFLEEERRFLLGDAARACRTAIVRVVLFQSRALFAGKRPLTFRDCYGKRNRLQ